MALNDVVPYEDAAFGDAGSTVYNVASGTTASIKAGEFVLGTLGGVAVTVWTANNTAKPVVATDFVVGVSTTTSTETASAAGTVRCLKFTTGVSFLVNPDTAATWNTQAKYDALVGKRVLLSTTVGGVQTLLAADGATSGIVVLPLDITLHPAKVRVALRNGLNYLT